ncbi:hypothetical protein JW872_01515 [Candidatus Babeliales bacterium]|nr:hypothetical protein [Candidatus Babeliales bacterium]
MKKLLLLALALIGPSIILSIDSHADEATSHTFFSIRPQYTTGSPEHLNQYRDRMLGKKNGIWGCFQTTVFGGQTTASDRLARFFLPWHKNSIIIAEGPNPDTAAAVGAYYAGGSQNFKDDNYDILAHNFNIISEDYNFASRITFSPKQSFIGTALNYKQSLSDDEDKGWWIDTTAPIIHVSNAMNLQETMLTNTVNVTIRSGYPASVAAAMNQSSWNYGKIYPGSLDKTGISDFEIRVGQDSVRDQKCYRTTFAGIIFPTGNRPQATYVFEPMIGNNKHWGVLWGGAVGFKIWNNDTTSIWWCTDQRSHYLFESDEMRSFDLKDKSWSRYINVFTDSAATTTSPGINYLTKKMKIRPGGFFQTNTAFVVNHRRLRAEVGFNSYYSQTEDGELACKWEEGPAIAGVNAAAGGTAAESMSYADMHMWNYGLIFNDVDLNVLAVDTANNTDRYKPIKESDLDLSSALHPSSISFMLYGSIGIHWDDQAVPPFLGFGGLYEFGSSNPIADRWEVWFKAGFSI